jgi:hypothetical protein
MVAMRTVEGQLRNIGHRFRIFGRAEIKELRKILQPDETIIQYAYGYYHGGSGLLVATDKRLLLIDKRPFYLNLENMPFEYIKSINFGPKMLQGNIFLETRIKKIIFRSVSDANLKGICEYVKSRLDTIDMTKVLDNSTRQVGHRPYLNPMWRPHHVTYLPKLRHAKYYGGPTKPVAS